MKINQNCNDVFCWSFHFHQPPASKREFKRNSKEGSSNMVVTKTRKDLKWPKLTLSNFWNDLKLPNVTLSDVDNVVSTKPGSDWTGPDCSFRFADFTWFSIWFLVFQIFSGLSSMWMVMILSGHDSWIAPETLTLKCRALRLISLWTMSFSVPHVPAMEEAQGP